MVDSSLCLPLLLLDADVRVKQSGIYTKPPACYECICIWHVGRRFPKTWTYHQPPNRHSTAALLKTTRLGNCVQAAAKRQESAASSTMQEMLALHYRGRPEPGKSEGDGQIPNSACVSCRHGRMVISGLNFGRAGCAIASRSALPVNYRFLAKYALFPCAFSQHSMQVWTSVSGALTA